MAELREISLKAKPDFKNLMRIKYFRLWLVWILFPASLQATEQPYLSELLFKAREMKLSEQREWHVLMHYTPRKFGSGVISLADDEDFFLNVNGKTDSAAELESTLAGFFQKEPKDDQSARCRFPARYRWLKKNLEIDISRLPKNQCKTLDIWLNNLSVKGITLVFPVAYLNNPASMFGHTFLRLDSYSERSATDLLAWTVNFAARTEENQGLGYAVKGLSGGYQGTFTLEKYFFRVKEYGDLENRDLWEYQLDFTEDELLKFQLHLWELLPVDFDYYFLDENCSFQLLSLLEAARPEMHLSDQFPFDVIPSDTVRAVNAESGLLKKAVFRPSGREMLLARAEQLNAEEQELAKRLALGEIQVTDPVIQKLEEKKRAQVLELASEYISYLNAVYQKEIRKPGAIIDEDLTYQLLVERSKLAVEQQRPDIPEPEVRPDQGHGSRRVGIQYGYEEPWHYIEMDLRWAYHDLYDPQGGYVEGAQIEIFRPKFRIYPEKSRFQLEAFDLVSIISAAPRSRLIKPWSWQVSAAVKRERFDENDRPLLGAFDGGVGVSYDLPGDTLFSAFATASVRLGDSFSQFIGIGGGGEMELLHDVSERWRIGLSAGVTQYFQGITQTSYRLGLKQRFTVNQSNALVLDLGRSQEFGDGFYFGNVTWNFYF